MSEHRKPKYNVGQEVWVWSGDSNYSVTIAHVIPAGTTLDNGSVLYETEYIMEIHGPDIFYSMYSESACHEFKNCRPFPLHNVCRRDLKKEREQLIAHIEGEEQARKGYAKMIESSKDHIRKMRKDLEALNEEIKKAEPPVPSS